MVGTPDQIDREMLRLCLAAPPGSHFERDGDEVRIWYPHPADIADPLEGSRCRHPARARTSPPPASGARARAARNQRPDPSPDAGDDPPNAERPGLLPTGRDAKRSPNQGHRFCLLDKSPQPHGSGGGAGKVA